MPNRIVRDGILESHAVNRLSPEAELFYRRVMSLVDDFGRYEWDVQKLRLRAMGLRYEWATEDKIKQWMVELTADLVIVYKFGDKLYFELKNFNQRTRTDKSKYPSPEESMVYSENDGHVADIGGQLLTSDGHPRTYLYSETYTKTNIVPVAPATPVAEIVKTPRRSSKSQPDATTEQLAWFEEFYSLYWRLKAKGPGLVAFTKKIKTLADWEACKRALLEERPAMMKREKEHRPLPATWINREDFHDTRTEQITLFTKPQGYCSVCRLPMDICRCNYNPNV